MDHVAAVLGKDVRIECTSASLRTQLADLTGGCDEDDESEISLPYASKEALAAVLTRLQSLGVPFSDEPAGWSAAAVFAQLRDEGMTSGAIRTIVWRGRGDAVLGEG